MFLMKVRFIKYIFIYGVVLFIIAYLFYANILISLAFAAVLAPFFAHRQKKAYIDRQKSILEEQFKDSLLSLAASLRTGYSPENAWKEVHREMILLHGEKSVIVKETEGIIHKLKISRPLEQILEEFGVRSGVEDIKNFANVFKAAKRGGGDIVSVVSSTAKTISDKFDTQREIKTIISAKRMEQRVMIAMPAAIIAYMWIFNGGFLDILYESAIGRIVMTVCLLIYMTAFFIGEKIVKIEI